MGPYSYISEGWLLQPSIQLCELEGTLSNCITFLKKKKKKKEKKGRGQGWNSLAVQWLGPGASTAVARVQSLVREIRSRKSHDRAKKEKKVFFPRAVATNNDKLNVLNIYFLTFLKARILKSSCFDKAMGSRDEPLLASSGGSWHSLACSCITPLAASIITWPLSLGVFTWPFYKEGHQLLELESTPSWYDLN